MQWVKKMLLLHSEYVYRYIVSGAGNVGQESQAFQAQERMHPKRHSERVLSAPYSPPIHLILTCLTLF